jgi:hypothetical protein
VRKRRKSLAANGINRTAQAAVVIFSARSIQQLADIPGWARTLFPRARCEPGTRAWRISSKDLGRDLEEDLSIHPVGIEDFGDEVGLSPIDLVMRHSEFVTATDAALWLCGRLAIDPASLGYMGKRPKGAQPAAAGHVVEPVDIRVWDAADVFSQPIPPREWILGNIFCKQFISSLLAGGAVGKTAVRIVQALSVAIGQSLTGEFVHKRCRVLFLSFEDGRTELRRRLAAAMIHHGVSAARVQGWLFFANISGHRLIETTVRGDRVAGTLEAWLRQTILELKVELVVLDPFIKTHGVAENDNTGIDSVCVLLARLAVELDIAVDYLHHVRKGPPDPGNADIGRGASAAKDAARLVYTLNGMTKEDAQLINITNEALRRSLVRQDSAKLNIAPPAVGTVWYRLVGVPLNNGTPTYPHGDVVQTAERWMPPDFWKKITTAVANRILDRIDQGPEAGRRHSSATQAKHRAAWHVVMDECPELNEDQAKKVIAKWIETGFLVAREHTDVKDRHKKPGLFVGKRPDDILQI